MAEHIEASSSRSIEEIYESRWRKGFDDWDKTDAIHLVLESYLFEGRLEIESKR